MASKKSKDHEAVVLPSVRTYRLWTPTQLRGAEATADAGYLRHAVDLCDWILSDDKVQGALAPRVNAVLSAQVTFEGSGDKRRQKRAVRALEAQDDFWAMFPEGEARSTIKWALMLGFGSAVLGWSQLPGHEGRDIPVLQFFHPQPIRYDWHQRAWLRQLERGGDEVIEWGNGVYFGHMPEGTYRPWANGLWRGLAPFKLLKAYAIGDYGKLGEEAKRTVVEIDEGVESTKEKRQELAELLVTMGRNGAIVLPPGFHYKMVEASASTKDIYNTQIALANEAFAIAIRGGNLSTKVDQGSRAAAESQERTGDQPNRLADASAWETTQHDQSLVHWASSNYGDAMLAPWPHYEVAAPEDKGKKTLTLNGAMDGVAKAEALGFEVDRKAFLDEFDFAGYLKPGAKPEPVEPTGAPESDPKEDDPKASKEQKGKAKALLTAHRLASGASAKTNSGFIEGQLFADALVEDATAQGAKALQPTLEAVLEELEAASDYEDLRARLRARYEALSSTELSDLMYRAIVVAELAGTAAVNQDA